ncbi:MAG: glycoside hydrolase family 3 C-terminal domain-containing protein [Clostridia bacterium]|nr:glycoside hydrolase family 3 C-terminal domain-containing protein [Clostridia bacterium]
MAHKYHKILSFALSLLLLGTFFLQTVGCKQQPSDEDDSTEVSSSTVSELETEPESEPVCALSVRAVSLALEGSSYKLTLDCTLSDGSTGGNISCTLSKDGSVLAEQTAAAKQGAMEIALACPQEQLQDALTITVNATDANDLAATSLSLPIKGGLVQLSADTIDCVVAAMTLEEKAHMVTGTGDALLLGASGSTYPIERLGIPSVTVNDGPAGLRYETTIWYPSVINVSSSWDADLASQIGTAMGKDCLVKEIDVILAPGMNIQKNVLGGRNFEYCSEDPILTAYIATAYTLGIQSTGVGVSLKHFAANNQEIARSSVSANVTERALREIYLKAFGMTVRDADPYTIMSCYNLVNGTRVAVSYDLLTTYLRGECGFDGMVMSDWGSGGTVVEKVNAGNDINMPGNADDPALIIAAAEDGTLNLAMLDKACANVLGLVVKSPVFTDPEHGRSIDYIDHGNLAAEVAAQTMVLLQNDGTLPLAGEQTLAIFGNGAYATVYGGAGSGSVTAKKPVSIAEGLNKSDAFSVYDFKSNPFKNAPEHSALDPALDIEVTEAYAAECAEAADTAVIVISRGSTEGADRHEGAGDFLLNKTEAEMIERVSTAFHAKGKRVVVLLNTGSPIETLSWQESVDAILWTGYAGERIGTAVAEVLCGNVNPAAKTTITWPATYFSTPASQYFPGTNTDTCYYEDVYVGYRYYSTFDVDVAYPFGYGLSYTTFDYSDFDVQKQADGTLIATCTVTNTGKAAGREIVQLYVSKPETLMEQSALELAGFAKTATLQPGESENVSIVVTTDALESYDTAGSRYVIDGGEYVFSLAASAADIKETKNVVLDPAVLRDVTNIAAPDCEFDYIQKHSYTVPQPKPQKENLALGKTAFDNGHESDSLIADYAVDGIAATRWSGLGCSESVHVLGVDLGKVYEIGEISILWESLFAPFTVSVSEDGNTYTQMGVYTQDAMTGACSLNLYGQRARYIKLSIPKGNFVSIYELCVHEATEQDKAERPEAVVKPNLAMNKPITATAHEGAYLAKYAADGNMETRWGSLPSGQAWLQVDLEKVAHIDTLTLILESAWVPYRIEVSTDGENYTTIYNGQKDELFLTLTDLDIDAHYVRLWRDGENWFSIIELEIYE